VSLLLDTCVLSELWKPSPSERVVEWLRGQQEQDLFLSVLTLGEIQRGVSKLGRTRRASLLAAGFAELRDRLAPQTLSVTPEIALRWGLLSGEAARKGRTLHPVDGLLCATALVHGLTVATRNEADVAVTGVGLVNPWELGE
jgi:predicted nucleic acid-binding protein